MDHLRILTILIFFSLLPYVSHCQNELNGLWIDVHDEALIYFDDTTSYWVMIKNSGVKYNNYKVRKGSVKFEVSLPSGNFGLKDTWVKCEFTIVNDTLRMLHPEDTITLFRPEFDNYLDCFVNQDSIFIDIPQSSFIERYDVNVQRPLDIFIGFEKEGDQMIKIDDKIISDLQQVDAILNGFNSKLEDWEWPICRFFVDKKVEVGVIFDIQNKLQEHNLRAINYITKGPDFKPYLSKFYGLLLFLPPH